MIFTGWDTPLALLQLELIQREYEGHRVPEDLKEQVAALDDERDAMNFRAVDPLHRALDKVGGRCHLILHAGTESRMLCARES